MTEEPKPFESWAILEIMGHSRYAGKVTEQAIGGCAFVRVDVPESDGRAAFTKLFGQASIFSITPCSEELARVAARDFVARPVTLYTPHVQNRLDFIEPDEEPEEY